MSRKSAVQSRFFCTCCGKEGIPIWRKTHRQKQKDHLKKLYCLHCKLETNHREVRQYDIEFK